MIKAGIENTFAQFFLIAAEGCENIKNFFSFLFTKIPLSVFFALLACAVLFFVLIAALKSKRRTNRKKNELPKNFVVQANLSEESLIEIRNMFKEVLAENEKTKTLIQTELKKYEQENKKEEPNVSLKNTEKLEDVKNMENSEKEQNEALGFSETEKTLPEVTGLQAAFVEELEELSEVEPEPLAEDALEEPQELVELASYETHESLETGELNYIPSVAIDSTKFEGTEPLVIGDNTKSATESEGKHVEKREFRIFKPFDYINENNKEKNTTEESEALPLENLSSEKDGFMLTTFCANDTNVTDLPVEAIVLGEDGVFQISSNLKTSDVMIDEDFKKLVDSVIR